MIVYHPTTKRRYRAFMIAALISGGSLLPLRPILADQNSPKPGAVIENQATAEFTDTTDGSIDTSVSDKVTVTVAEVAGISATSSGVTNTAYRSNKIYFDFLIKNEGNDPTQFLVPAAPSAAEIAGIALPATSIGQLEVIEYNDGTTSTPISTNNAVNTTNGSVTSSLTGIPNGGSIPAGGYIKVRVPITVPFGASIGDIISVTLGNTNGQISDTNTPYIVGANGTGTNDLYTQDNPDNTTGETNGVPMNGDGVSNNGDVTKHRQEASATKTTPVVAPPNVTISGKVWNDANGTGSATFTTIEDGAETVANTSTSTPALHAILVDSAGKVLATTPVDPTAGTYSFVTPGVQNGLYVILSTSAGTVGTLAPTPAVPNGWTGTTPLTYVGANAFNVDIANVTGKDFGIEKLPDTANVSQSNIANPPGLTQYQVPTLDGADPEDGVITTGNKFKIVAIPASAQGILYYNGLAVTDGQVISSYDPTLLKFDPVDGTVTMSFTYAAIDAAGKEDPTPGTATMGFKATPVNISGTVIHDRDASAVGFTNILTAGDAGTDAVFGTTTTKVNAIIVDVNTGFVLNSKPVNPDGTYSFTGVPPTIDVKIIISPTPGVIGNLPPAAAVPTGWAGTSPSDTGTFNSGLLPTTNKDFGIRQKAKLVLLKLITGVNGQTTNPNDGTVLNNPAIDTFNTGVAHWPANYLFGTTNAGYIKPGDKIEYTVYFLNNQGVDANNVKLCDPVRGGQTYVPNTIELQLGNGALTHQSDSPDILDHSHSYSPGSAPNNCNATASATGEDNGGIAIGIPGADSPLPPISGATSVGVPTQSYGLFRFTTKVKH